MNRALQRVISIWFVYPDQKRSWFIIFRFETDPARFATREDCARHYHPETKQQAMQWENLLLRREICWHGHDFDFLGFHWNPTMNYLQKGQTTNGHHYANLLRHISVRISRLNIVKMQSS